jgi:hypothetical protein
LRYKVKRFQLVAHARQAVHQLAQHLVAQLAQRSLKQQELA